jgi:hypothetical protein
MFPSLNLGLFRLSITAFWSVLIQKITNPLASNNSNDPISRFIDSHFKLNKAIKIIKFCQLNIFQNTAAVSINRS